MSGALTLVGAPKAGFDSMDKFLAAARANPSKYQFGSTENTTRMVGELFRVKSGLKIENVAYKGAAPMMQELVGGHIPVGLTIPLTAMSHHRNGTLRMLAVTCGEAPDGPARRADHGRGRGAGRRSAGLVLIVRPRQPAAGAGAAHPGRCRGRPGRA